MSKMRKLNIILALIVACLIPCPILALINFEWAITYFIGLVATIIGIFALLFINALSKNQMEDFEQAKRNLKNAENSQQRPQYEVKVLTNKEDATKAQKEGFEVHEIRLSGDTWMCTYCQTINSSEKAFCVNCGASRKEV
jgi:uncharacterized membrane protein